MVYFFQEQRRLGSIKIGTSRCPKKRIKDIQTGNPNKLKIIAVIPGGPKVEARLHSRFSKHQCEGGKDWFKSVPEIMRYIKKMQKKYKNLYIY